MSKDQKDVSEYRDFRAIIADFLRGGGDVIKLGTKQKPANEKERVDLDEQYNRAIEFLDKTRDELKETNKKIEVNLKTEQEKNDLALFAEILQDKLADYRKNPDLDWDFSDFITSGEDVMDNVMNLKIPRNAKKTIEAMINDRDPTAANRIRKNNAFQGRAANFFLLLYKEDCVLSKGISELSNPENLKRSIKKISKSTQDILLSKAEVENLYNTLDSKIKIRLTSPRTAQADKVLQESMEQLSAIRNILNDIKPLIQYINDAEYKLNLQQSNLNMFLNSGPKQEGEIQRGQVKLVALKDNLNFWVLELPKRLNTVKGQINQNLKKLDTLQENVALNKGNKENESLLKQIEILKKEKEAFEKEKRELAAKNDALIKENQTLKQENQALKKAAAPSSTVQKPITPASQGTAVVNAASTPTKVTPLIAKPPALPPTPPKSPTTASAVTPPPVPSAPAKPVGVTQSPKPLTLAQQIAQNKEAKEAKARADGAGKAVQDTSPKIKPQGK